MRSGRNGTAATASGIVDMGFSPSYSCRRAQTIHACWLIRCRAASLRFFPWARSFARGSGRTQFPDLFHALADALLDSFTGRPIIDAVLQIIGQALHVCDFAFDIVRVLIIFAV